MSILIFAVGIAAVGLCLALAGVALAHRGRPGAWPFAGLVAVLAAIAVLVTGVRAAALPLLLSVRSVVLGIELAAVLWAMFAVEYTGRGPVLTRRRTVAVLAFPFVVILAVQSTAVLSGFLQRVVTFGVTVLQLLTVAIAMFGAFVVVRSAVTYDDLPVGRAVTLATGGVLISSMIVPIGLAPVLGVGMVLTLELAAAAGASLAFAVVQVRYGVFESGSSAGHLAREAVFEEMSQAVVVVDREGRILDTNRSAERTFGIGGTDALGESLADRLDSDPGTLDAGAVTLDTADGRREFEVTRSLLRNRAEDPVGRSYLFRDVTDRRTHEQQLDVLNRVFRHNLRNDLDAVRAFAESLQSDAAAAGVDTGAIAGRIHDTATGLVALGETAGRAERLLDPEPLDPERVDLGALVRGVVGDFASEYPAADVVASVEAEPVAVHSTPHVLETVLRELVGNAVDHADSPDPRVEVVVRETSEGAAVEVRDDGPGIPDRERSILLAGEETPLRHGSGLGLWLVNWGVTRLGGDLSFGENDPRGSVVTVRIPHRRLPDPGDRASDPRDDGSNPEDVPSPTG